MEKEAGSREARIEKNTGEVREENQKEIISNKERIKKTKTGKKRMENNRDNNEKAKNETTFTKTRKRKTCKQRSRNLEDGIWMSKETVTRARRLRVMMVGSNY